MKTRVFGKLKGAAVGVRDWFWLANKPRLYSGMALMLAGGWMAWPCMWHNGAACTASGPWGVWGYVLFVIGGLLFLNCQE